MKRKVLFSILVFTLCICLVGCNKKEEKKEKESKITGGWEIEDSVKGPSISNDILKIYNNSGVDKNYELVALLGKQVVSGTNYMFLVKDGSIYKIIVVYNNLENKATVTSTIDFDITKYVNKDISNDGEKLLGGWNVDILSIEKVLDDDIQIAFDKATKEISGITYTPIGVLGHQIVSGTNYAVLAYGELSTKEENNGIYLLTLYKDLDGNSKIVSSAYIDLANFNK